MSFSDPWAYSQKKFDEYLTILYSMGKEYLDFPFLYENGHTLMYVGVQKRILTEEVAEDRPSTSLFTLLAKPSFGTSLGPSRRPLPAS